MEEKNNKDQRQYEFNEGESRIISELASAMNFVGIVTIILGVFSAVAGALKLAEPGTNGEGFSSIIEAVLYLVIGVMTHGTAGHFSQVAKTEGNDISYLMQALDKLRAMYVLQKILIIIVFVLLILAFLLFMPRAITAQ